jgi:hypothetical protein
VPHAFYIAETALRAGRRVFFPGQYANGPHGVILNLAYAVTAMALALQPGKQPPSKVGARRVS